MGLLLDNARRDAAIRASFEATGVLAARYGISSGAVNRIRNSSGRALTNRERFQLEVIEGGWAAACMDPADWSDWVKRNPMGLSQDTQIAVRPCHDCPAGFAAEMRSLGRCNGNPGTNEAAALAAQEETVPPRDYRAPTGGAAHRFTKLPGDRDERMRVVLDAVRTTASHADAGTKLGVSGARVEQIVSELRRAHQLPADVDELLRARTTKAGRLQRTPPSEEVGVLPEPLTTESQAPEASAPATAADELPATGPADEQVATPPGPIIKADVDLPCWGCAHAAVCAIKPELEAAMPTIEVSRPHPAIHLAISCDHFLEVVA